MAQLDSVRATEAKVYMETNNASVLAHAGAAYEENEILKTLVNGTASTGILSDAYKANLLRGVPTVNDRGEAYRLTHTLMFATNFGRLDLTGFDVNAYGALLDELVVTYADDVDVLGELLISAKCIAYTSSALDSAYASFTSNWDSIGRDSGDFANNYHQILVGGLLFAME